MWWRTRSNPWRTAWDRRRSHQLITSLIFWIHQEVRVFNINKFVCLVPITFIYTGADTTTPPNAGGPLPRPDALFTPPGDHARHSPAFANFVSLQNTNINVMKLKLKIFSIQGHSDMHASPEVCAPQTMNSMATTLGRSRPRPPRDVPFNSFATMRRDHIIADSIPGPESCV